MRVNLNTAARSSRAALTRRTMSSESHASHGGRTPNDTPWIVRFNASVYGVKLLNVFFRRRLDLRWCSVLWCVHTVDARILPSDPPVIHSSCTLCLHRRAKALMDTMSITTTVYVTT